MVKLKFFSLIRKELGVNETEVDFTSGPIIDLLRSVEKQLEKDLIKLLFDQELHVKKGTIILLNGRNIVHLQEAFSEVESEDEISIFPPGGGG